MRSWTDFSENRLILPKYLLYFGFYAVALLFILDISRYGFQGYTPVVLGKSEITLLREGEDASLCPSVYCVLIIYGITVSEQYVIEFLGLPYLWGILSNPSAFLFLIFLSTESSSSYVKCPSLMLNCLLIIFLYLSEGFRVNSGNVVSIVVFILLGWKLSFYLSRCSSFCSLRLPFSMLS